MNIYYCARAYIYTRKHVPVKAFIWMHTWKTIQLHNLSSYYQEVDFSCAPQSNTSKRRPIMSFSGTPFYFDFYTVIIRTPTGGDKAIFKKPFKYQVWASLGGYVLFAGLVLALFIKCNPAKDVREQQSTWNCIWTVYGTLLSQGTFFLFRSSCPSLKQITQYGSRV